MGGFKTLRSDFDHIIHRVPGLSVSSELCTNTLDQSTIETKTEEEKKKKNSDKTRLLSGPI